MFWVDNAIRCPVESTHRATLEKPIFSSGLRVPRNMNSVGKKKKIIKHTRKQGTTSKSAENDLRYWNN